LYYAIEVIWRGRSHPSMFAAGGFCFLIIGGINNAFPWSMSLTWQALIGAAAATAVEFAAGMILNVWLGLGIWDYSRLPLNVMGQICLPYSLAWIALSAFAVWLDDYLRWKLYGERKPEYKLI
jgi:uncharacterized membrane protein